MQQETEKTAAGQVRQQVTIEIKDKPDRISAQELLTLFKQRVLDNLGATYPIADVMLLPEQMPNFFKAIGGNLDDEILRTAAKHLQGKLGEISFDLRSTDEQRLLGLATYQKYLDFEQDIIGSIIYCLQKYQNEATRPDTQTSVQSLINYLQSLQKKK